MKFVQKRLCILTVVCMLISLITVGASSLVSAETMDKEVVIYYPNGDWGLTPVDTVLSMSSEENIYVSALRQLIDPGDLPVGCYDEFPDSFRVEGVDIVKDTAFVTISSAALYDSELSDQWLNTLGDIISYNLFYMNKEIHSVKFVSSSPVVKDIRSMDSVEKDSLLSAPKQDSKQLKDIPQIDFDYERLAKMSKEERNQTIQDEIDKVLGNMGTQRANNYKVCIDPGHGGTDPGAVSGGIYEKTLNLAMALEMRDYLKGIKSPYPTFDVIMTRSSDVSVSLTNRHNLANNNNVDAFISIHCNSSSNSNARGATALYPNNHDVALSRNLGDTMIEGLTPPMLKHRDAYYDNKQVLRNTNMPATIVECGFISNSSDRYILSNDGDVLGFQLGLATNIWCQVNL